jgi:hypothetical protein
MNPSLPSSEIIRLRTSRRTYRTEQISKETLTVINQKINAITSGPLGTSIKFTLISLSDSSTQKLKLGTYGFIQGARYFIAGSVDPSTTAFLDYGYLFEKLILELTRLQLGTCWLGGTFDRGEFAKAISLSEGHVIPAISPVGIATSSRGLGDRLIRLGAGSKNRLSSSQLFFDKTGTVPLVLEEGHPEASLLESIRLGPSASNNQPWRIVADGNLYRFYLCRKPGYQKAFSKVDIQMLDIGIAMAHFDLVAEENGLVTEWRTEKGTAGIAGWEYVISVLLPR